jgi:hypothetical protein
VHTRAKKRLNQASSVDNLQRCGLQCASASLVMRPEPPLYDARLDAMTNKFARRE